MESRSSETRRYKTVDEIPEDERKEMRKRAFGNYTFPRTWKYLKRDAGTEWDTWRGLTDE